MTVEHDATLAAEAPSPVAATLGVTDTLTADDSLADPSTSLPRPAARIGRFRVERELGRGTMGVVYLAHDEELGRKVAIKLLQRAGETEETHVRMLREAQALARVNHPNIVAVHEVGLYAGQVYVAMEYVQGEPLDAWIAGRRPPWQHVLAVFRQAGAGLAAAHAVGLVHRDFKPANCILGDDGRVRVLDFGVARRVRDDDGDELAPGTARRDPTLTRGGRLVGSPAYMAAELFAGARADARSDLHAFCVSLYEALYGERPFVADDLLQLAAAIHRGAVSPVPKGSKVPTWLRAIVLRGLRPDPEQRWPSMPALLAALAHDPARRRRRIAAALAGIGLLAAGLFVGLHWNDPAAACDGSEQRIAGVWNPERADAIATAFAATGLPYANTAAASVRAALDTYASGWAALDRSVCEAAARADAPAAYERRMLCLAERRDSLAAFVDVLLAADARTVERAVATARGLPPLAPCADLRLALRVAALPDDPDLQQFVAAEQPKLARARALFDTAHYDEAETLATTGLADADARGYDPLRAAWRVQLAKIRDRTARYADAEADASDAYFTARRAADPLDAAAAAIALVTVNNRLARFDAAALWRRLAHVELRDTDLELHAGLRAAWAAALIAAGRYPDAIAELQLAIDRRRRELGPDHLELASLYNSLGVAHFRDTRRDAAADAYRRALQIRETELGPHHPDVARTLSNLASVRLEQGDVAAARAAESRALQIRERALGPDSPDVALSLGNLALIAAKADDTAGAEQHYLRALQIQRARLGERHPTVGETLTNLGTLYFGSGRRDDAALRMREAAAIFEDNAHPNAWLARSNLGYVLFMLGRLDDAAAEAGRALAIAVDKYGADHPLAAYPRVVLARIATARGRPDEALAVAEPILAARTRESSPDELHAVQLAVAEALVALRRDPARARTLLVPVLRADDPDDRARARALLAELERPRP